MKNIYLLSILALLSFGCTDKSGNKGSFVIKTEIPESYFGESGSKISFVSTASGVRNLNLEDPNFGITQWYYLSSDVSMSDAEYIGGGWRSFGTIGDVLRDDWTKKFALSWDELINTNQYKYITILSIVHRDLSDEVIIQTWERYKIDWK